MLWAVGTEIHLVHRLARRLIDGEVHNRIVVPVPAKHQAKLALDRMLRIV